MDSDTVTANELGEDLGIDPDLLRDFVRHHHNPSVRDLMAFAATLGDTDINIAAYDYDLQLWTETDEFNQLSKSN